MDFKYYTQEELDLNKIYIQEDNFGYRSIVKIFKFNGNLFTNHPLNYKCTTIKMCEFSEAINKTVTGTNSNGTFIGTLTHLCLPYGKFEHKSEVFVRWHQGQRNIPAGWVNINALTIK